jgi:hypothetical protein
MGGGLLQLVAYGAQDAYLSGNPQITFWRGLFKRHTNFAMEPFRVNMTGQAAWGTKHSAVLGRHADLVSSAHIELEVGAGDITIYDSGDRRAAFNFLEYAEIDIGGQVIDRQYGEFLYLWSTLAHTADQQTNMDAMVKLNGVNANCNPTTGRAVRNNLTYIPLMFFFCRNPGAALPLIALQYHEVKINILWNKTQLIFTDDGSLDSGLVNVKNPDQANLVIDYVYLDVEERRRMAQESHEYLIEQTQYNEDKGLTSANNRVDLTFNHPVKELIWVTQNSEKRNCRLSQTQVNPLSYDPIIYDCSLQLNGQDRVPSFPGEYYSLVQRYQHHSGSTLANQIREIRDWAQYVVSTAPTNVSTGDMQYLVDRINAQRRCDGIYSYSFAIKPEEHQPSGTCNFSRIDTATLIFNVGGDTIINKANGTPPNSDNHNYDIRVYALNYNILRVMSGMGGLAYSN